MNLILLVDSIGLWTVLSEVEPTISKSLKMHPRHHWHAADVTLPFGLEDEKVGNVLVAVVCAVARVLWVRTEKMASLLEFFLTCPVQFQSTELTSKSP